MTLDLTALSRAEGKKSRWQAVDGLVSDVGLFFVRVYWGLRWKSKRFTTDWRSYLGGMGGVF